MNEEIKLIEISKIFTDAQYVVPVYQRNFSWGFEEIEQLIDDIDSSDDEYYLGNLIVNKKSCDVYEVIDGQQRLTTLYLLEKYLGIPFSNEALRFEAREKSNETLTYLSDLDQLDDKLQSTEIINGFRIIENYFETNAMINNKEAFKKKLSEVNLVRVQVPENIDLNSYFEIMNTRGEQLELHEIVKAKLLSKLKETEDKLIANDIWEYCSNMGSYVQMNFHKDKREKIFNADWSDLLPKIVSFDTLSDNYKLLEEEEEEEKYSLRDILEKDNIIINSNKDIEEPENERFESIISFPNFLLQVNKVVKDLESDDESSLDDKELISILKNNWSDESSAKHYLFMLLKLRILFDRYVLKREHASYYKQEGKWSLQRLEKYTDDSGGMAKYVGTYGNDIQNKIIRSLQSALRITYTSPKTMHWISLVLSSYFKKKDDENIDIQGILEEYCKKKLKDSKYQSALGFQFERIVFNYLDYIIYRDGYTYKDKVDFKPLKNDWTFQYRNSIEHFYPQNPAQNDRWDEEDLNSFGNLALITVSGNSTFNNAVPIAKASTYPKFLEQSLKLEIMAEMMKKNDDGWDQDLSTIHKDEMFKLLDDELKI